MRKLDLTDDERLERTRAQQRASYLHNKEQILARNRAYAITHAEEMRAYRKKWKSKNPTYDKQWKTANPENVKVSRQAWRARKQEATVNDFTTLDWLTLLVQYDNACAYCGSKETISQDHKIPLSRNGDHTMSNIVPACLSCNKRKNTKTVPEFLATKR